MRMLSSPWGRGTVLLPLLVVILATTRPTAAQGLLASVSQRNVAAEPRNSAPTTPVERTPAPAPASTARASMAGAVPPPAAARPAPTRATSVPQRSATALSAAAAGASVTAADMLERMRSESRTATADEMREAISHWRQTPAEAEAMGLPRVAGERPSRAHVHML